VTLTLDTTLKQFFAGTQDLFEQIMQKRGQVFRELEGRRTQRIELGGTAYFLKQHFGVGWREILKNLISGRLPIVSAKNEWQALQRLQELGVATLTVAGFGCRGMNPAQLRSFLLTPEIANVISLEDLCKNWITQSPTFKFKQALITAVAETARRIHQAGINHRDFYLCHFLWEIGTAEKLYLIDLHRAQIRKKVPQRWLIKDLAGLYFSSKDIGLTTRDIWRFIKAYRQEPLRCILNKEPDFWKKVKQRGDKLYRRHDA
jgi:heptose I phosphotransferase